MKKKKTKKKQQKNPKKQNKTKIFTNKPVCLRLSVLEISKTVMFEFWMISGNQDVEKKQNYVTWIQTSL